MDAYPHAKRRHRSSIQSWHIADLILGITFGIPWCAGPHPCECTESYWCIYVCLTTWKKSNSYLTLFLKYNSLFPTLLGMLDYTHLKWLKKLGYLITCKKTRLHRSTHSWDEANSIPTKLWACTGMPGNIHLKCLSKLVAFPLVLSYSSKKSIWMN